MNSDVSAGKLRSHSHIKALTLRLIVLRFSPCILWINPLEAGSGLATVCEIDNISCAFLASRCASIHGDRVYYVMKIIASLIREN